jgi:hypothetical protein
MAAAGRTSNLSFQPVRTTPTFKASSGFIRYQLTSDREVTMKGFLALMTLTAAMVTSTSVSAAEINVMSGGAPKEVFALLAPKFEQQTGNKVKFTYAVITALHEKLAGICQETWRICWTPTLSMACGTS